MKHPRQTCNCFFTGSSWVFFKDQMSTHGRLAVLSMQYSIIHLVCTFICRICKLLSTAVDIQRVFIIFSMNMFYVLNSLMCYICEALVHYDKWKGGPNSSFTCLSVIITIIIIISLFRFICSECWLSWKTAMSFDGMIPHERIHKAYLITYISIVNYTSNVAHSCRPRAGKCQ